MRASIHHIRETGILLALFMFASGSLVSASNDNYPAGARAAAMGTVAVMYSDFWSNWNNQAGLGFYPHLTAGIHHENRYLIPEFSLHAIGLTIPTGSGTLGFSGHYFGYPGYHENKIGLAFGKAFNKRFAAGLQLDYLNTYFNNELRNSGTLAIEAGILAKPVDQLSIGFHIFNPTGAAIRKLGHEKIPVILRLGLAYQFGERLLLGLETEKDIDIANPRYKMGLEYRLIEYIYVRLGVLLQEYVEQSFGIGFNVAGFHTSLAFSYQQLVGYTPYFSLFYVFR